MNMFHHKNHMGGWFATMFIILIGAGLFVFALNFTQKQEMPVMCTLEARLCPDGSYVGRAGPKCEFAPCPGRYSTAEWKIVTDTKAGLSFRYPEEFPTTYIDGFDWPPKIQVLNKAYSCTEGGQETARAGETRMEVISGREYCVTTIVEGAAGSIYTQHAYAFAHNSKTVVFTFTTRATQCGNYDEEKMKECQAERDTFSIDKFMSEIVESVEFTS